MTNQGPVRGHWEIKSMHWSLDVIFGEDFQAKRNKNGILNFNTLSKCAISLLVEEKTVPKIQTHKTAESLCTKELQRINP
jgi:predicted transposase YbfD/YdcC